ncbi:MAG: PA2169 family four-helix-bundle protein [Ilumatobacteraceae bacterium]
MSNDAQVTKKVIEVLEDGKLGFADAADKLADSDRADLAPTFRKFSEQRATFAGELERLAAAYGDDIDESGSVKGTLHRGWMAVKDALSGSDPDGVLDAAEQGEDRGRRLQRCAGRGHLAGARRGSAPPAGIGRGRPRSGEGAAQRRRLSGDPARAIAWPGGRRGSMGSQRDQLLHLQRILLCGAAPGGMH